MKTEITISKPKNWQDFETLCFILWGEIWDCPEIKKNGRSGQSQHGIDVYGIPSFEKGKYYGIQCKGKDEYTNSKLSKKEIDKETELAKKFNPKLKKLYFATTANKDTKIEEYVRNKNIENQENGLFEVHIYSWEDIAFEITRNKKTFDYYVLNNNFNPNFKLSVSFDDGRLEKTIEVPYKKILFHTTKFRHNNSDFDLPKFLKTVESFKVPNNRINKSLAHVNLKLKNIGNTPIHDYKIILCFEGTEISILDDNLERNLPYLPSSSFSLEFNKKSNEVTILPKIRILVQEDELNINSIYIKSSYNNELTPVLIRWNLISNGFKDGGELKLNLKTKFHPTSRITLAKNIDEIPEEIEDYFDDI